MHRETQRYGLIAFLISIIVFFPSPYLSMYIGMVVAFTVIGAIIGSTRHYMRAHEDRGQYVKRFLLFGGIIGLIPLVFVFYRISQTSSAPWDYSLQPLFVTGLLLSFVVSGISVSAAIGRGSLRLLKQHPLSGSRRTLYHLLIVGFVAALFVLSLLPAIYILGSGEICIWGCTSDGYRNMFTDECTTAYSESGLPWYWQRDASCKDSTRTGLQGTGLQSAVEQECNILTQKIDENYCSYYVRDGLQQNCDDVQANPSENYPSTATETRCNWQSDGGDSLAERLRSEDGSRGGNFPMVQVAGKWYNCLEETDMTTTCPTTR